jgi:NAD(P)H dehydrogenase (quinone)
MLSGRKLISFTSSGAPNEWVVESGAWEAMRRHFDHHFAAVCGLSAVDHVNFGGVGPGMRSDAVERCAAMVRKTVADLFPAPALT